MAGGHVRALLAATRRLRARHHLRRGGTYLNNGLDIATVDRGVTAGIARTGTNLATEAATRNAPVLTEASVTVAADPPRTTRGGR